MAVGAAEPGGGGAAGGGRAAPDGGGGERGGALRVAGGRLGLFGRGLAFVVERVAGSGIDLNGVRLIEVVGRWPRLGRCERRVRLAVLGGRREA